MTTSLILVIVDKINTALFKMSDIQQKQCLPSDGGFSVRASSSYMTSALVTYTNQIVLNKYYTTYRPVTATICPG